MKRYYHCYLITLICAAILTGCSQQEINPFRIEPDDLTTAIHKSGHKSPLLLYRHAGRTFKTYVQELRTPAGINILRDAPHDHLHHHGLMMGLNVDGANFWAEKIDCGTQLHAGFSKLPQDKRAGWHTTGFIEQVEWMHPNDNVPVLQEERLIEVYDGKDLDASLLTWQSRFELPYGKTSATIKGTIYYGLGMRFVQSMDLIGRHFTSAGPVKNKGLSTSPGLWCAYKSKADGKDVTVVMFDHPSNPRHPATWFTMVEPFAYTSATLNLSKKPFILTKENPLLLRYGVALWDNHVDAETINKLYQRWIKLPPSHEESD